MFTSVFEYYILCLFPLIMTKRRYATITRDRFLSFAISVAVLFVCVVAEAVYRKVKHKKLIQNKKFNVSQIIFSAYFLWSLISALTSDYLPNILMGESRFEGLLSLLLYCTVFLTVSRKGSYSKTLFNCVAITATIMGLIAILQLKGSKMLYPEGYAYANSQFISTAGNIDIYAGFVSIFVPMLFAGMILEKNYSKFLAVPAILLLTISAIKTDVDTAKLGLLVGVVGFLPFTLSEIIFTVFHNIKLKKKTLQIIIAVVLLVLILVAIIFVYNYKGNNRTLKEGAAFLRGNLSDSAGSGRGKLWKASVVIMKDNPIFGTGPGSFKSAYAKYSNDPNAAKYDMAHNDFLQIGACQGIVGLLLYVSFVVSVFVQGIKSKKGSCLILLAGALGYLVYSFFVFSIAIVSPLYWVLMGLAVAELY